MNLGFKINYLDLKINRSRQNPEHYFLHKRCVCKPAMCPVDVGMHYWKENENSRQFIWQNQNLIVTNSSFDPTFENNSII